MTTSTYTRTAARVAALFCTAAVASTGLAIGCSSPGTPETGSTSEAVGSVGLVISGVYGAGGNAGATFTNDFIELYNRGANSVSLQGMSVQYGSATGDLGQPVALPNVTVAPGRYFLIQLSGTTIDSGANGVPLPTADLVGSLNMSSTNGKVALASVTTALACGGAARCANANIVDMVGYGTASDFEGPTGSAVPALALTTAAFRKGAGCTDSDVNLADFDLVTPVSAPRNQATTAAPCSVPGDGGTGDAATDGSTTDAADDGAATDGSTTDATDDGAATDGGTADATDDGAATDGGANDGAVSDAGSDAAQTDSGPKPPGDGTGIVISQVYGGGGNNGAPLNRDFVELFNRTNKDVPTTGLSIQYGSATRDFGTAQPDGGPSTDIFPLPDLVIPSGAYILVGMGKTNPDAGAPLPTPDVEGTLALGATAGKVALAKVTTSLGCGSAATRCAGNTNIVDMVGYGPTSTEFEGTAPTAVLSNTTAAARKGAGCTDGNDNAADFDVGAPAPRNIATPRHKCAAPPPPPDVDSGTPGDDAGSSSGGLPPLGDAGHGGGNVDAGGNPAGDGGSGDTGGCNTSGTNGGSTGSGPLTFALAALGVALLLRRRN